MGDYEVPGYRLKQTMNDDKWPLRTSTITTQTDHGMSCRSNEDSPLLRLKMNKYLPVVAIKKHNAAWRPEFESLLAVVLSVTFIISICSSEATTAAATEVLVYKVSGPRSGDEITHILAEPAPYVYVNFRPVIGILAQDYYGPVGNKTSFIAASYVKWIEGAGARVLPIFLNKTEAYYDEVINLVNGVLFPGGAVHIDKDTGYGMTGRLLYKKVLERNQKEFLPLWGTCLGMELVLYAHLNGVDPRIRCSSTDDAVPLNFTNTRGRLFGSAPSDVMT
ncbi:gamma-glutamyl hydrolase A-like [Tropilaelaps mercedesae]|uniref:folate gamma-glutamyl hydrolase n=1 Tax=Tropilaelaps mercedesae TaxID=418985 RepID=A0A1V9XHJ0_9ACAR|nr:gamma-glutamyl hydrolase A-like [Tropilaelaps mercedesae]